MAGHWFDSHRGGKVEGPCNSAVPKGPAATGLLTPDELFRDGLWSRPVRPHRVEGPFGAPTT